MELSTNYECSESFQYPRRIVLESIRIHSEWKLDLLLVESLDLPYKFEFQENTTLIGGIFSLTQSRVDTEHLQYLIEGPY